MSSSQTLAREALRLHDRYQKELIERFSVCPWAKTARLAGRVRTHVLTERICDVGRVAPTLEEWCADETVDVAFVIAPRFRGGPNAFAAWSETLGQSTGGVFVAAPFHPEARGPGGIIQFFRQTPDPTTQLVRRTLLDSIRAQDPPHYADIFELDLRELEAGRPIRTVAASVLAHNTQLVDRLGKDHLQAIIDDIHADRERSYASLNAR